MVAQIKLQNKLYFFLRMIFYGFTRNTIFLIRNRLFQTATSILVTDVGDSFC